MDGEAMTEMDGYEGERDELVAAAFAASDLLVEIEDDGTIAFIAGAMERIGASAIQSPVGLPLYDLFDPADRQAVRDHVAELGAGRAVPPLLVRLRRGGVQTMLFGGCRMPQARTILFLGVADQASPRASSLNLIAETERGLMSRPVFTALAMRRLPEDIASGLKLAFIEVAGFTGLGDHVPAAMMWGLATAIARQVRLSGAFIEAVGDLGRGRYGVLYRGEIRLAELEHAIASLVQAAAPAAPRPRILAAKLDPDRDGIHGRKAARVLRYAMERFALGGERAEALAAESALDRLFPDTLARVDTLERVIADGDFDLAYQPVVDLTDRGVRHAEVLVRFADGTTPLVAVAAAEAAGMIGDFDLAICARAIEHLHASVPAVPAVAVNLSGRSLEARGFPERLSALLDTCRVPPQRLMFELTETAILGEVESVNRVVQDLRQRGHRFCLDDLGSGANSFHFLRSIPVDFVKIDGAFGRDALRNERDRSFLRYVSGFCRENGILAIAEMIETEADAVSYRELGIDYGQGYLFGRPTIHRPPA
ncbi:MAG TPA: EAL domain-containing protein [Stellaceae bacterium]|nr:EAL domain-containing protein [Stellaceae bacterium]